MLAADTTAALTGAIELFLGRPSGLKRFDLSFEGFWRSFAALLYILPFFAIVVAADWMTLSQQPDAPALTTLAVARLFDVGLDFGAMPVVLALLARRLGIQRSYIGYVIVRNWSTLVIVVPQAVISLLFGLGIVSMEASELMSLVVVGVMLFYQYRIARWTLGWNGTQAAGLVAADLGLSLILLFFVHGLFGI
ncbi:hypothetical protein C3941_22165 [Kaistia algarum]|uniref:hypothetical protein n=1 Tax=Kaistia algarum TaxID=2083279 RepID=UPI000CE83F48|nr:hypothetical protein [Kaistia algarum]MCX5516622.1 hypothetical protein [Kaistia algarum]PPE77754.1 hypothetical protein C3941_22165 [Kaistia algarum]